MKQKPVLCGLAALLCLLLLLSGCAGLKRLLKDDAGENLNLPRNDTDMAAFSKLEDGTVTYPGARQGIDISGYQQYIDWSRVRAAGIDFAILQIGFRGYGADGTLNSDVRFAEYYSGAEAVGIDVGVYFYSQATSVEEAREEARYVLELLEDKALQLPVFYDWEEVQKGRTKGLANSRVGDYAKAFCEEITAGGYSAGVYFNQKYGYSIMGLEQLRDYAFWLAEYNPYQSFSYAVQIWQYTGQGAVDGVDLPVDRDLMYLEEEETE